MSWVGGRALKENGRVGVKPPITIHIIPTGKQQLFTLSPLCQQLLFSIYIISTAITITQFTLSTLQTLTFARISWSELSVEQKTLLTGSKETSVKTWWHLATTIRNIGDCLGELMIMVAAPVELQKIETTDWQMPARTLWRSTCRSLFVLHTCVSPTSFRWEARICTDMGFIFTGYPVVCGSTCQAGSLE